MGIPAGNIQGEYTKTDALLFEWSTFPNKLHNIGDRAVKDRTEHINRVGTHAFVPLEARDL